MFKLFEVMHGIYTFVHTIWDFLHTIWFGVHGVFRFIGRMMQAVPLLLQSLPIWLLPMAGVCFAIGLGLFVMDCKKPMQSPIPSIMATIILPNVKVV